MCVQQQAVEDRETEAGAHGVVDNFVASLQPHAGESVKRQQYSTLQVETNKANACPLWPSPLTHLISSGSVS
eukprot:7083430-Pyramimonas_sp.AAC.1